MFIFDAVGLVCQYCNQELAIKTRPQNDLLCFEWDVKLFTLHGLCYYTTQIKCLVSCVFVLWRNDE